MKVMIDFTRTLFLFPAHWRLWLIALFVANAVAPLFFLASLEGRVVLVTGMVAGIFEMAIFAKLGFVRLVGLGHFVWFPLIPWLWIRLDAISPDAAASDAPASGVAIWYWVIAVIVLNCLSLVIDMVDVVRYLRGERAPHLVLKGD